ncbi:cold shock domain-containing protein CG9705-like [Lineus longissimus]|uniref:cold shock domain-containing protein CG9705-like n=1 Tax=Lineus longissimus TaxID=88925 RepID=UPI002B4E8421
MSDGEPAQAPHPSPLHNVADPNPNHHPPHGPVSPISPTVLKSFLIPSPVTTRRTRTQSQSQRAAEGPHYKGHVVDFCRNKGHGFVTPDDPKERLIQEKLFVHVSDIDGDFIPEAGDLIEYKKCLIPPKNDKYQAVHLRILSSSAHQRWDSPSK